MIKVFSNLTDSPKVVIQSKIITDKTTFNGDWLIDFDHEDTLFVRLTIGSIDEHHHLASGTLRILYHSPAEHDTIEVYSFGNQSFDDETLTALARSSSGILIDKINKEFSYIDDSFPDYKKVAELDITPAIKDLNNGDSVVLAVKFVGEVDGDNTALWVCDLDSLKSHNELCTIVLSETRGLSGLYKFDEHNMGSLGCFRINLASGHPTYLLPLLDTVSDVNPISLSVLSWNKANFSNSYYYDKLINNYSYYIGKRGNDYFIEDYSGAMKFYCKVEREDDVYEKLGIKNIENMGDLYYCKMDQSYFYLTTNDSYEYFKFYDQQGTYMYFEVFATYTMLLEMENAQGFRFTFEWDDWELKKIKNDDDEAIEVEYSSTGFINKYSCSKTKQYVTLEERTTEDEEIIDIKFFNQGEEDVILCDLSLFYSNGHLFKIYDNITNNYVSIVFDDNNRVSTLSLFNDLEMPYYSHSYNYLENCTVVTNARGNKIYHYYDSYGRVRTILDEFGNVSTFNYDEIEGGVSKNVSSVSQVRNSSKNLLRDNSFEHIDLNYERAIWIKNETRSLVYITNGGPNGYSCLRVDSVGGEDIVVYQEVENLKPSSYVLSGIIMHPENMNWTTEEIIVKLEGSYEIQEEVITETDSVGTEISMVNVTKTFETFATFEPENTGWYKFETNKLIIPMEAFNIKMFVKIIVSNVSGTVFFDNFNLSEVIKNNRFNYIENGYMEFVGNAAYPFGWNMENCDASDGIMKTFEDDYFFDILGNCMLRIKENRGYDIANEEYTPKRIYQTISLSGLASDSFELSVFARGYVSVNQTFKVYIKFMYEILGEKTYEFDFDKNLTIWQMLSRSVTTEDNYSSIEVGILYDGCSEIYLDCFQLFKDSRGKQYIYDEHNNLVETVNGDGLTTKKIYDKDNLVEEVYSSDGNHYSYVYEGKQLRKATDLYGNTIEFEYDDKKRVTKQIVKSGDEEISVSEIRYDGDNVICNNEHNEIAEYTQDYLKRVVKVMNPYKKPEQDEPEPIKLSTNYTYDEQLHLSKIAAFFNETLLEQEQGVYSNEFTYNDNGDITVIITKDGQRYEFEYDDFNRIVKILKSNNVIEEYEYEQGVSPSLAQITKKFLAEEGDCYEFEYDERGQLVQFKLNGNSLAQYSYDEYGYLYILKDVANNVTYQYSYDLKGNLVKENSSKGNSYTYIYDSLGNVQKAIYNVNGQPRSVDYEYPYEAYEYSREGYFSRLNKKFKDEFIVGGNAFYGAKECSTNFVKEVDEISKINVMRFGCVDHNVSYKLSTFNKSRKNDDGQAFDYDTWCYRFYYNKTLYAWVKPSSALLGHKYNLFSFVKLTEDDENNSSIEELLSHLSVSETGKLIYCSSDGDVIKNSNLELTFDAWNLVGIKFNKLGTQTKTNVKLFVNNQATNLFEVDQNVGDISILNVANQHENTSLSAGSSYTLDYALISMGAYSYTDDDIKSIYLEGVEHMVENTVVGGNGIYYYNPYVYDGFDVATLCGTLESSKGLKPKKVIKTGKYCRLDKAKTFKYDKDLNRHIYGSYPLNSTLSETVETSLQYQPLLGTTGTISLRFKYETLNQDKCIISVVKNNIEILGIYLNSNGIFKVVNGITTTTTLKECNPNTWNTLTIVYSSNNLKIYCNGTRFLNKTVSLNLIGSIVHLGNNKNYLAHLNGCLEMFAYKNSVITEDEIDKIVNDGAPISVRKQFDKLGRITENTITINDNQYTTSYQYDKTRVESETLPDGTVISYEYHPTGNIKSKTIDGTTEEYKYDDLGRLIKVVDFEGLITNYVYDTNGNLTNIQKVDTTGAVSYKTLEYRGNKLTKITNNSGTSFVIPYNQNGSGFYPTKIVINDSLVDLTWQGKRLTNIAADNKYYYNHSGIRIKKETPDEITTYELEGTNIISMNKVVGENSYRLDFTYDSNNQLVGLTTEEGNYFYIRDITKNIVGLIDSNGEYVVKYEYDAWGNILKVEKCVPSCIAADHNPFKYKGYYYDDETQLFYCNSRYYSPELCRFISPDSIEYLDPQSINGLNLYCYCGNNPVMGYDPNGTFDWNNFWKTALGVIAAVGLAALAIGATIVSGGSLGLLAAGFAMGAAASFVGQGIGNVLSGENFFNDFSLSSIIMGGLAGAAFITGVGGFWGAVAIGAVSNAGTSALENKSWANIVASAIVGGVAAGIGFGVGRVVSNHVFKNSGMTFMDYFELGIIDTNAIFAAGHAFAASWYTFLPSLATSASRGVTKALGNKGIGWF